MPLVVAVIVVVLAVGAVTQIGPASAPARRAVDRSFAALAAPIVAQSNASGSALGSLLAHGAALERVTFFSDLATIAGAVDEDDRLFGTLSPPAPSGKALTLCGNSMSGRRRAVARAEDALERLLGGRQGIGGGDEATTAASLVTVGRMLSAADASWAACRRSLLRAPGSARLPTSRWVVRPSLWGEEAVGRLTAALVSSSSLAAVHRLGIVFVSTAPPSVPGGAGVSVVEPTDALAVKVVVANQGNVDEKAVHLAVRAVTSRGTQSPPRSAVTSMGAGDAVTLVPPALSVRPGTSYVVTVTATAVGASTSTTLSLRVSSVPPPPTTTTTTSTTTSTTTAPTPATTAGRPATG